MLSKKNLSTVSSFYGVNFMINFILYHFCGCNKMLIAHPVLAKLVHNCTIFLRTLISSELSSCSAFEYNFLNG